jgi:hypothetical protein
VIKVVEPSSFNFDEALAAFVKLSRRGLIGQDFKALEKRAGWVFADRIKKAQFAPGEVPVHLIALGATESVGPNRNGDGFREDACRSSHDSFVRKAKFFRDHQNHASRDPHYGTVKLSAYNDAMRRVELVVGLYETKEAAAKTGGRVADQELEKLAKEEVIPVSMSCRVSHDSCSSCGNKAKSRKEYCRGTHEGGRCKHGGLANNMAKVAADGHVLHADNPDPVFFDISNVGKQADYTAYALGVVKAAAQQGRVVSGAELAELLGVTAPAELLALEGLCLPARLEGRLKLAKALAEREAELAWGAQAEDRALALGLPHPLAALNLERPLTKAALADTVAALTAHRVPLSLPDFLALTGRAPAGLAEKAAAYLPGAFGRLLADPDLERLLEADPLPAAPAAGPAASLEKRAWAYGLAPAWSLAPAHVQARVRRAAYAGQSAATLAKAAARVDDRAASEAARDYARYRLACLEAWASERPAEAAALTDLTALQLARA